MRLLGINPARALAFVTLVLASSVATTASADKPAMPQVFMLEKAGDSQKTAGGADISLSVAHDDWLWGVTIAPKKGDAIYGSVIGGRSLSVPRADEWVAGDEVVTIMSERDRGGYKLAVLVSPYSGSPMKVEDAREKLLKEIKAKDLDLQAETTWRVGNWLRISGPAGDGGEVEAGIGLFSGETRVHKVKRRGFGGLGLHGAGRGRALPNSTRIEIGADSERAAELQLRAAGLRGCVQTATADFRKVGTTRTVKGVVKPGGKEPSVQLVGHAGFGDQSKRCVTPLVQDAFAGIAEPASFELRYVNEKPIKVAPKPERTAGGGISERGIGLANVGTAGHGKQAANKNTQVVKVVPERPEVDGALDSELVRRVVRQHRRELKWCYKQALKKDPKLKGRLVLEFTISASGPVVSAKIASESFSEDLDRCLVSKVKRWVFPEPKDDKPVTVKYPFNFAT